MPTEADRVLRDFERYTGDGLPNAPTGKPLPQGDPASGVHNPRKAELRELINGLEIPVAASTGTPHYTTQAIAAAATIPVFAQSILVGDTVYRRVASNPYTKSGFQDTAGNWWSSISVRTTGPIEVWVAWGQSEMRGVTNSPAAIGGDRKARDNVLSYVRGTTIAGVADGWYAVGPEDDAWPFASSLNAVGSAFYLAAAKRAEEIGGTVCIVPYAIGGAESGLFLQGGSMWVGLQASWSGALAAPIPGRGGQTLTDLGKTLSDVVLIWQGPADADYKLGTGDAAATADDWVVRWRTILNSLESPSGMSVPVIRADLTKIIFFEMLHGGTGGGAPGVGNPTDSRNRDLHKLLKYTSGKRAQIRIVPMAGVNNFTSDPEVIGSPDNLHPNGAAYNEISNRLQVVLRAFDPAAPEATYFVHGSNGEARLWPDGRYEAWSPALTTPNNITVADGAGFRTSNVTWTFPLPGGYTLEEAPHVLQGQCTPTFSGVRVGNVTASLCTSAVVSGASIASPGVFRLVAQGKWAKS